MNTSERLVQIYRNNVGEHEPTKRQIDVWTGLITVGQKNFQDFVEHVSRLDETKSFRKAVLLQTLRLSEILQSDPDFNNIEKALMDVMTAERVDRDFVVRLSRSKSAYAEKRWIAHLESRRNLSAQEISDIVEEFKCNPAYSVEDLMNLNSKKNAISPLIVPTALIDIKKVATDDIVPHEKHKVQKYDEEFVKLFETAFKRPMFVHEYFRYHENKVIYDLQDYNKRYVKTREIYKDYLGTDLDEYTFVKEHLDDSDTGSTFYEELESRILMSSEYEATMKNKISLIHSDMYDFDVESREMVFIFDKVRKLGVRLEDDALGEHVIEFKSERDYITERISDLYEKIMKRLPDPMELDDSVVFWRSRTMDGLSESDLEKELEMKLCASLEFHEIIKDTIKMCFKEKNIHQEMMPSIMYALLSKLISSGRCKDLGSMHEACKDVVSSIQ